MGYDWKKIPLANTRWRKTIVSDIAAILIRRAKQGIPITYGELAEELERQFGHPQKSRKTLYGPPVGAVGQAIRMIGESMGENIPPINVIVVRRDTGYASTGADEIAHYFFSDHGKHMKKHREAYLDAAADAVYAYSRWDDVERALGIKALPIKHRRPDSGQKIELPKPTRFGKGESDEHKILKRWIRDNPKFLKEYGLFPTGQNEFRISSGDSLDVHFENETKRLAVEVKTSKCTEDELMRGIFQCVKYRAVLRAEQLSLLNTLNVESLLLCTRKPRKETALLMKRLHVSFVLAPLAAETGAPSD